MSSWSSLCAQRHCQPKFGPLGSIYIHDVWQMPSFRATYLYIICTSEKFRVKGIAQGSSAGCLAVLDFELATFWSLLTPELPMPSKGYSTWRHSYNHLSPIFWHQRKKEPQVFTKFCHVVQPFIHPSIVLCIWIMYILYISFPQPENSVLLNLFPPSPSNVLVSPESKTCQTLSPIQIRFIP